MNETPDNIEQSPQHSALESLLDAALGMARDMLGKDGEVEPFVLFQNKDGKSGLMSYEPPSTAMQRRSLALQAGNKMRGMGVVRYCHVAEAWVTIIDKNAPVTVRPSQDPDRFGVLGLEAHDILDTALRYYMIDDSHRPPTITLFEDVDAAKVHPGGTWSGLLTQHEAGNA